MPASRSLGLGAALGLVLAFGRLPLGLDWVRLAAVDGPGAASVRAGALALVALVLGASRGRSIAATPWCLGLAFGVALGLLVLDGPVAVESPGALGAAVLVPAALALWFGRNWRRDEDGGSAVELGALGTAGLVLGGAGAAAALDTLARPLSGLGLGLPTDDAVSATVLVALVALGAVAFGPLVRGGGTRAVVLAVGPALVALGTLVGWWFLGRFEVPGALARQLTVFGLSTLDHGSLAWNAVLAAPVWVAPAFALGAWCAAAGDRRHLAAVAAGAALGLVGLVWLREGWAAPFAGELAREGLDRGRGLRVGALVAGAGALLVGFEGWRRRGGLAAPLGALALVVAALFLRPGPQLLLSPWQETPVDVEWALETSDGLLTVERTRFGERIATLDRRWLTPGPSDRVGDLERLGAALSTLGTFGLDQGPTRVLFVGLLTPERAAVLTARPGVQLERTAPWYPFDLWLEGALLGAQTQLPGRRVSPDQARADLEAGRYALVIAAPAKGVELAPRGMFDQGLGPAPRPATGGLGLPAATAGVAWFDAAAGLGGRGLSPRVVVQLRGLEEPHVAALAGVAEHWPTDAKEGRRAAFAGGGRTWFGAAPIGALLRPARARIDAERAALFARLARAAEREGTATAPLAEGLALHFGAQSLSPTWASPAEAIELDERSLAPFARAARELGPDPLAEQTIEALAALLVEKQRYEDVLAHLPALTELRSPWLALELALVDTYRALLADDAALERVAKLLDLRPGDPDLWLQRGELELALDRPEAAASLRRALELDPEGYTRRRRLALALVGAGLPEAEDLVRELLRENPFDNELRELGRAGPR